MVQSVFYPMPGNTKQLMNWIFLEAGGNDEIYGHFFKAYVRFEQITVTVYGLFGESIHTRYKNVFQGHDHLVL